MAGANEPVVIHALPKNSSLPISRVRKSSIGTGLVKTCGLSFPQGGDQATADGLELRATHRAGRERLAMVTGIVTPGVCTHARPREGRRRCTPGRRQRRRAIVTPIVTHGIGVHALTAWARSETRASSSTS